MNPLFSPEILREIGRNISRSLTDTFQMMFQMDILTMPPASASAGDSVCAHIDMANADTSACLSVMVSRKVVESICARMQFDTPPGDAVIQDVVCEIANIVSNHLRSYMADKMGIEFKLSLPKAGLPARLGQRAIDLHFRLEQHDCIELGFFSYAA